MMSGKEKIRMSGAEEPRKTPANQSPVASSSAAQHQSWNQHSTTQQGVSIHTPVHDSGAQQSGGKTQINATLVPREAPEEHSAMVVLFIYDTSKPDDATQDMHSLPEPRRNKSGVLRCIHKKLARKDLVEEVSLLW